MTKGILELDDFGNPSAEFEDVVSYFVKTPAYEDIFSLKRPIVLGRKGSGKTAIYKSLAALDARENVFVTGLTFRDYPWALHESVGNTVGSQQERYVDSWMFLIAIELAIRIVRTRRLEDLDAAQVRAFNAIEKFLKENYGRLDPDHKDIYKPKQFKLFWRVKPEAATFSVGEVGGEVVDKTTFANRLHEIARALFEDLKTLIDEDEIHLVLFDELDLGIDMDDAGYRFRIIGLLLAAKYVKEWASNNNRSVAAVVFLRTDIFRVLSFSDRNKLATAYVVRLEWSDDHTSPQSLKVLLDARIRLLLDLPEEIGDPWTMAFEDANIRGTQHKCDYMGSRSMLRPRNFIKFANLAMEAMHDRIARMPDSAPLIIGADILEARQAFSRWLVDELDDEVAAHFKEWKRLLDPLRRIGMQKFSLEEYEKHFSELGLQKALGLDYLRALDILYKFGVIGHQKVGGGGGGSSWYWTIASDDVELDPGAKNFQVFLGLKEALDLRERDARQRKNPMASPSVA